MPATTPTPEDPIEEALIRTLSVEPRHIDEVARLAQLPMAEVSSALTLMELKGLVRQVGALSYVTA
jgi:DNA processing protein